MGARLRVALVPVRAVAKPARVPRYPNRLGRAALPPCWTKLPLPVRSRSSVTLDRSGSGSGEPLRIRGSTRRPAADRGEEREHVDGTVAAIVGTAESGQLVTLAGGKWQPDAERTPLPAGRATG